MASYLLDFRDHYTSHTFNELYWTGFERHIDREDPSAECAYAPPVVRTELGDSSGTDTQHDDDEDVGTDDDDYDDELDAMGAVDEVRLSSATEADLSRQTC